MNVSLVHGSFEPIIYGVCLFLSVISILWKVKRANYLGAVAEVTVIGIILIIHGGSVTGGFAATIAGLLSGVTIPIMFPQKPRFGAPINTISVQPRVARPVFTVDTLDLYQPSNQSSLTKHIFDRL